MGRYISGCIEGKCWFGVQPSDFADRFGRCGNTSHIEYNFDKDDLPTIEKELESIKSKYGKYIDMLDEFFEKKSAYSDNELMKYLEIESDEHYREVIREYADYKFGVRLRDYLKENDDCWFDVEL